MAKLKASIIGGSGYAGGEVARILLLHPQVELAQVTSESHVGEYLYNVHPNLRGRTKVQFTTPDQIVACDVLFLALPHGEAQKKIEHYASLASRIVDLSADFRLHDMGAYKKWYGEEHHAPNWVSKFVYGLPELHRAEMKEAKYISGVGCNATASNLALLPLVRANLLDTSRPIVVDIKVGSSEGGNSPSLASHHPERSGSVRTFSAVGHRHTGEVEQELGLQNVHLSITSIEMVRGVLATAHCFLKSGTAEKDLWRAYRGAYKEEPFVRIVKDKTGIYRYPEPKILSGSNYADVGFEYDEATCRLVSLCAIDNLMKGAAGSAVQAMNLMCGFEETMGLEFAGLHPI
ncbi:MAG: N-acetyl-gamma-glutamyl-phosphate reductase [Chloroflexi bacterium]|nr:N-acetyl-gamma-glutamyl-phosphate reductase [Chloroflexota bacterium]